LPSASATKANPHSKSTTMTDQPPPQQKSLRPKIKYRPGHEPIERRGRKKENCDRRQIIEEKRARRQVREARRALQNISVIEQTGLVKPLDVLLASMSRHYRNAIALDAAIGDLVPALIRAVDGPDAIQAINKLIGDGAAAREAWRLAQQAAVDAAPYVHPKLAAVAVDLRATDFERMTDDELRAEIERESVAMGLLIDGRVGALVNGVSTE
jgi:hypothetical protein